MCIRDRNKTRKGLKVDTESTSKMFDAPRSWKVWWNRIYLAARPSHKEDAEQSKTIYFALYVALIC